MIQVLEDEVAELQDKVRHMQAHIDELEEWRSDQQRPWQGEWNARAQEQPWQGEWNAWAGR
jgi:hypothetical protein